MKNHCLRFFFLFLWILPLPLLANIDWQKYQIQVTKTEEKQFGLEKRNVLFLEDSQKRSFEIVYTTEITQEQIEIILQLKNNFYSWQNGTFKNIQFIINPKSIDILLFLNRLEYKKENLFPLLLGRMEFFYANGQLFYDFRLLKENKAFKIKGVFEGEEALLDILLVYVKEKDPEQFLISQAEKNKKIENNQEENKIQKIKLPEWHQSIRIFTGTGALLSLGYSIGYKEWEFLLHSGIIYYETTENNIKQKKSASSLGGRLAYFLLEDRFFAPYLFAGGAYNFSLQNYASRSVFYAGIGQEFFYLFLVELAAMYGNNALDIVVGLGLFFHF